MEYFISLHTDNMLNSQKIGNSEILIVDESVNDRKTREFIQENCLKSLNINKYKWVSLIVYKNNCKKECYSDFYVKEVDKNIVFPWQYGI